MAATGDRLKEERLRLGMSQTEMADIGGVTKKTQGLYEKGERHPDSRYLSAVAEAGVDVLYILTGNRSVSCKVNGRANRHWQDVGVFKSTVECLRKKIEDIDEYDRSSPDDVGCLSVDVKEELVDFLETVSRNPPLHAFVTVPLHDVQGSCGDGSVIHSEQVVDYLAFKRDWISRVASDPNRLALIEAAGDSMMPTINSGDLLLLDLCINRIEQDAIYAISVDGMLYIKRIQKRLDGTVIVKSDNPNYEEQRFTADEAASLRIVGRVIWMGKRV